MKLVIMDTENSCVRILEVKDNLSPEDIDLMLTEKYDYSLNSIHWMICNELKILLE